MSNVAASNFTSLYNSNASPIVPAMPYGDANVVTLLNNGTVAGNTVGNIDAAGNITAGGEIAATGNITTDGYFVGNFAGNISGNIVVPGLNTQVLYNNNGNAGASAGFTFDSATNAAVVTGNVTAQYFVGNGSQLTGLPASYGNANVAGYLPTYTGNLAGGNAAISGAVTAATVSTTGNIAGGNAAIAGAVTAATVSTTGNIAANYFVGNGSLLTGISGSGDYSNANVQAYLPTYTGALTALTGNVTTTANISGNYILGNGSQLTGITATSDYGNANVSNYLNSGTNANNIVTTGNIAGNYFIGNGALLTGISAAYGNANVAAYLPTYTGNLEALTGNVTTTATLRGGNIRTAGFVSATGTVFANTFVGVSADVSGNANVGNLTSSGSVSVTGNITGDYILGNGSQLTGLPATYGNANVAAYLPTYTGNLSAGNITSTGNITGNLVSNSVYASQTAGFIVNGPAGQNTGNLVAGNVTATNKLSATGDVVSAGNVSGGNLLTGGNIVMNGTPGTYGFITAPSNIRGANLQANTNITAGGAISAAGNITGNYFIGNGSLLTGVVAVGDYSNANVAAYLPTYTGNLAGGNANITNTVRAASVSTSGVSGDITGVNTITANTFVGNGAALTGVPSASLSGVFTANIDTQGFSLLSSNGAVKIADDLTVTGNITGNIVQSNLVINSLTANTANITTITGSNMVLSGPANVTILRADNTGNSGQIRTNGLITASGNIQGGNIRSLGLIEASGNITTGGNITADGEVRATTLYAAGNISAPLSTISAGDLRLTGTITFVAPFGNVPRQVNFGYANIVGVENFQANSLATFADITATGNVIAREFVTANSCIMDDNFWTDGYIRVVPFGTTGAATADSQVQITPGLVDIGLRNRSAAGNSTIEFHTSTANIDYDSRIQASGGGSNAGEGIVTITAANTVMTGNVTGNYFIGNGSMLTGIAGGDYSDANVAAYLPTYTGNLTSLTGDVTTTANISGNYIMGNGSLLTGIVGSDYSDANVAAYLPTYTGNLVSLTGDVTTTANISGNYILGNGSQLTGLPETYSDANVAAYLPTYTGNLVSLTGDVTTTANVTANYFIGDGSQLTGISGGNATPGGSNTQIQFNDDGEFAGNSALTFDPATDTLQIGNIAIGTNRVQNSTTFVPATSGMAPGQIIVGNGFNGNVSVNADAFNRNRNARVAIWGSHEQGNTAVRSAGQAVQESVILTGNVTNTNSRMFATQNLLQVGGGASNFNIAHSNPAAIASSTNTLIIGQSGNAAVGNTSVGVASALQTGVFVQPGSSLNTGVGVLTLTEGNVANYTAFSSAGFNVSGANIPTTYTVLGLNPNLQGSLFRQSPNYLFLNNADAGAASKVGPMLDYGDRCSETGIEDGVILVDNGVGMTQFVYVDQEVTNLDFAGFDDLFVDVGGPDQSGWRFNAKTITLWLYCDEPQTVTLDNNTQDGTYLRFANGVKTLNMLPDNDYLISITLSSYVEYNEEDELEVFNYGLVTISPGFV